MSDSPTLWEETVQPGATWSHALKRGTAVRITDVQGGANVGAIFYNYDAMKMDIAVPSPVAGIIDHLNCAPQHSYPQANN